MSPVQSHRLAGLALIVLTAAGCVAPLASPSASPLAIATVPPAPSATVPPAPSTTVPPAPSATVPPPVRLQFVDEDGTTKTFTIDIDDQSGLLVEATDGEAFSTEDPGAMDLEYGPHYVVSLNDASDDSILRVVWAAGGGCAASYAMTIDPTARKLRIEEPPAGGDSIGGSCGVTLRFSEPVPAEEVEGVLADQG